MREIKRLIFRVFTLLELVKTPKNQPLIQQIRGLLFEILDQIEKEIN